MRGCRALESILPFDKSDGDGSLVLVSPYEWRLNMRTGEVTERSLTANDTEFSMDVPIINEKFTGLHSRFGYTQVFKSIANSAAGIYIYIYISPYITE